MEIGLHLPSAQPGASADGILEVARAAEELGFDSVWMFDHLFTPVDLESRYPYSQDGAYPLTADAPFFDPLGLFGVLAGKTERVKIGTGVLIAAYRHPLVLGKVTATIEQFAPDRLVLGVGAGWMREEFDAVDVDYSQRGRRLDEYIEALRVIWSGEPKAFDGEFYRWQSAGFLPAPTTPIPLIVGGHSDAALRRAARLGDGWAMAAARGATMLAEVARRWDDLKRFLDEAGRDPDDFHLVYQNPLWFSDQPNAKLPLTGPPESIAESLRRLEELGVTMVDLLVFGPPSLICESADRFAREVRPLL